MKKEISFTWWGSSAVEIDLGHQNLVIDPYLHPESRVATYVCITNETHSHCHEPTLERLTSTEKFMHLLCAPSCLEMSRLDTPVGPNPRDLSYVNETKRTAMYPKFMRRLPKRQPGPTEIDLGAFHITAIESNEYDPAILLGTEFMGKRYKPDDGTNWPAATGNFVGAGRLVPLGYLIAAREQNVTFYHPGALQEAFDSQRELRGKVDYLFLPLASAEGVELSIIDNVRPRVVVPILYRPDEPNFPIPLLIEEFRLTTTDLKKGRPKAWADPAAYRKEFRAMMAAHWYPTVADGLKRMRDIAPDVRDLGAEILVAKAGKACSIDPAAR